MPTYEYRCRDCGEHLEVVQSFRDDPLTDCPACGGALRKVFGAIGIAFKGSGFYKTDSRSGSPGPGPMREKQGATTESGGGGDSSSAGSSASTGSSSSSSSTSPSGGGGAEAKSA